MGAKERESERDGREGRTSVACQARRAGKLHPINSLKSALGCGKPRASTNDGDEIGTEVAAREQTAVR